MVFELIKNNSVANQFFSEIRDVHIQKDRLRFRRNLERLGEILAYELSKTLDYQLQDVRTPLGNLQIPMLIEEPILVPILRAAIPFYQGVLNIFDKADSGFVGAWRVDGEVGTLPEVELNYLAAPSVEGRIVILIDPMLATGRSLLMTLDKLMKCGNPAHIHILSLIASRQGIAHVADSLKLAYTLWTGAIDEKLDDRSFIVPGLGDAGDLSFGTKL